jgi:hypothetical protein
MKTKIALLALAFCLPSLVLFSQTGRNSTDLPVKKNLIGIQYNPLINKDGTGVANLFSLRYSYKILKPLDIGLEIDGTFLNNNFSEPFYNPAGPPNQYYWLSPSVFLRYTIRPEKRIQGFLEGAAFNSYFFNKPVNYNSSGIDIEFYIAPGLSFYSKNKRFSLDLYYKYSTYIYPNQKSGLFSYKINYHF